MATMNHLPFFSKGRWLWEDISEKIIVKKENSNNQDNSKYLLDVEVLNPMDSPEMKKMRWRRSLSHKLVAAPADHMAQSTKIMWGRSPAWLNLLPETKTNRKVGAYKALLVADEGCWPCLGQLWTSGVTFSVSAWLAGPCWCWHCNSTSLLHHREEEMVPPETPKQTNKTSKKVRDAFFLNKW